MKKVLLSLAATAAAYCVEIELPSDEPINSHFTYMNYGTGLPALVNLNLAHRRQTNHHGVDVGLGGAPLMLINEVHGFANYLYYPKPDLESQIYYGLGIQGGGVFHMSLSKTTYNKWGYAFPQAVIGKSYTVTGEKQHFMQFTASAGGYGFDKLRFYPTVGFTTGISF